MSETGHPVRTASGVLTKLRTAKILTADEFQKVPLPKPITMGTHDGTFHCDECVAIALLKCLDDYDDALVIRTRDPAVLGTCDIVCDVGGAYDPLLGRFDHHQRGFNEKITKTKLSSAGLIWRHYGAEILSSLGYSQSIYDRIYERFIEHIDGISAEIKFKIRSSATQFFRTVASCVPS